MTADEWLGEDKALHFAASVVLSGVGYGVSSTVLEKPWQRALAGSVFSLTVGGLKELADSLNEAVPSWQDMAWNVAGTAAGVGLSVGIDYLIRHFTKIKDPPIATIQKNAIFLALPF